MIGLQTLLHAGAALAGVLLWFCVRLGQEASGHRRLALVFLLAAVLVPNTLLALGAVPLRGATVLGLLLVALSVGEAALVRGLPFERLPQAVRVYWVTAVAVVLVLTVLDALHGHLPAIANALALIGLGVGLRIQVDRELLDRVILPVWLWTSVFMLLALPLNLLDGAAWGEATWGARLNEAYANPVLTLSGLEERWSGIFPHPNGLGAFAAIGFAMALVGSRKRPGLMVLSILLLGLSASRTAALAAIAAALVFVFRSGASGLWKAIAVLMGTPIVVVTTSSIVLDKAYATGTGRFDVWQEVPGLLSGSWLAGLGPDAAQGLVSMSRLPTWAAQVHNLWLNTLLLSGVVGLVAMLFLAVSAARLRPAWPLLATILVISFAESSPDIREFTVFLVAFVAAAAVATPSLGEGSISPRGMPAAAHSSPRGRLILSEAAP